MNKAELLTKLESRKSETGKATRLVFKEVINLVKQLDETMTHPTDEALIEQMAEAAYEVLPERRRESHDKDADYYAVAYAELDQDDQEEWEQRMTAALAIARPAIEAEMLGEAERLEADCHRLTLEVLELRDQTLPDLRQFCSDCGEQDCECAENGWQPAKTPPDEWGRTCFVLSDSHGYQVDVYDTRGLSLPHWHYSGVTHWKYVDSPLPPKEPV